MPLAFDLEYRSVFKRLGETLFNGLEQLVKGKNIYQHQADAVTAIKQELLNPPSGGKYSNVSLAVLPTGTGKTGVGVLAAYACKARRVLIITPSVTISKQQYAQFTNVQDPSLNPLGNKPFLQSRNIISEDQVMTAEIGSWTPVNSKCALKKADLDDALAKKCELVVSNVQKFGDGKGRRGCNITKYPHDHFSLVIVDEAHHFPARTWEDIVKHFQIAQLGILFLTATPYHRGDYILSPSKKPCFVYKQKDAEKDGIIREINFVSVSSAISDLNEKIIAFSKKVEGMLKPGSVVPNLTRLMEIFAVLEKIKETLQIHDGQDEVHYHKAMVVAKCIGEAEVIAELWNEIIQYGTCKTFVQDSAKSNLDCFTTDNTVKVLVVIFRLTEGFDYSSVSVVAILRNVAKKSRVYFAQFVGRAVRKLHKDDPVTTMVISHDVHKQRENYDTFYKSKLPELAEDDPEEEEDPEDREEGAEEMETN